MDIALNVRGEIRKCDGVPDRIDLLRDGYSRPRRDLDLESYDGGILAPGE